MSKQCEKHIELQVELAHDLGCCDDYNQLVINKGNHHQDFDKLDGQDQVHTITWILSGNASSGVFCELDSLTGPGFQWLVRKPGEKVFEGLKVDGKKLTVRNHHHDKSSEGRWYYQLFARFGRHVYGVPLTFTSGPASSPNPSIKNN
ncbi:hypothetical protein [Dyella sp. C9]|uniref:hypothetical protein n=1 Tax=Dyella sp. C9 TaxID=2202154 RepID=UPI000DEF401D|nr:hypothetical protein [Dyella sp. C9]